MLNAPLSVGCRMCKLVKKYTTIVFLFVSFFVKLKRIIHPLYSAFNLFGLEFEFHSDSYRYRSFVLFTSICTGTCLVLGGVVDGTNVSKCDVAMLYVRYWCSVQLPVRKIRLWKTRMMT